MYKAGQGSSFSVEIAAHKVSMKLLWSWTNMYKAGQGSSYSVEIVKRQPHLKARTESVSAQLQTENLWAIQQILGVCLF